MAWDSGTEVAVAGQSFGGALRLVNEVAREDAIDRRIAPGGRQYVQGWARRTDGSVTAMRVGLETQDEARSATATALLDLGLGSVGTWTPFSGAVDTAADHVWARPYLEAVGGGGEFAEIYIGPQGPLAWSALTEAQVRGRWLGDYPGDAAADLAGFQPGDLYLDTSVFPNRVRAKKSSGAVQTVSLAPGTVSATSMGTSNNANWVVAARVSLANVQSGSLIMASGDLFAQPSNGTSLANSTGFQGRAKLYEATPGQTTFTTLDPARAIGDEWTFTVLNDGSNFADPDFTSSYDAPALRRLKSTPDSDIVLLIRRDSGTNNVTDLGARLRPTVFGV